MHLTIKKLFAITILAGAITLGLSGLLLREPAGWTLALCGFAIIVFIARQRLLALPVFRG